jgi:hypothetical protein
MPIYTISQVFNRLRQHLMGHADMFECFSRYEFQAEGWLKAEWINVLHAMKTTGDIKSFASEVDAHGRGRIDLVVELDDGKHWIELKPCLVGRQKTQVWGAPDIVSQLRKECNKFRAVQACNNAWIVVLCAKNPGPEQWARMISKFHKDYSPLSLLDHNDPKSYPSSYYLGVLQVQGLN